MNIVLAGENSIIVYFGEKIDPALPAKIANFSAQLTQQLGELIIDFIPAYTSLQVFYDIERTDYQDFCAKIEKCLQQKTKTQTKFTPKTINIPVYYGFDVGLDLERLLAEKNLSLASFIALHSATEYLVYAIGFSPVFAFLGELDERIQAPRLATPRLKIPAGSVGIANSQTAIYPSDSSGGWNIIGQTPLDLSLANKENIDKFSTGDKVIFTPISKDEFSRY